MQREIIHGVPYFISTDNTLWSWNGSKEEKSHCIGVYDSATKRVVFNSGICEQLQPILDEWRTKQQPRPRKPTVSKDGSASTAATTAVTADAEADTDGGSD